MSLTRMYSCVSKLSSDISLDNSSVICRGKDGWEGTMKEVAIWERLSLKHLCQSRALGLTVEAWHCGEGMFTDGTPPLR